MSVKETVEAIVESVLDTAMKGYGVGLMACGAFYGLVGGALIASGGFKNVAYGIAGLAAGAYLAGTGVEALQMELDTPQPVTFNLNLKEE